MKAVFSDGRLVYLGNDGPLCSDDVHEVHDVLTLDDLAALVNPPKDQALQKFEELLQKIEDLDLDAVADVIVEKSEKAVAEVRSLGIKSMEAVGSGFIALGELFRRAAKDESED